MKSAASTTAIIIGQPENCRQLQQQLELLTDSPVILGWIFAATLDENYKPQDSDAPLLGSIDQLESIIAKRKPALALVSLPAAMKDLITTTRTRLRRLGIVDRFMPTLVDLLNGIGPRNIIDTDLSALIDRPPRQINQEKIRTLIAGKRILITGAGGSIGSEIARICSTYDPAQLILIDRSENALFEIDRQISRYKPQLSRRAILHDIVDAKTLLEHFRITKPNVVFHAAAHKHVPLMEDHPAAAVDNNFFGTKSVADASREVGVDRFVMISTDKAVKPQSIMGMTKRLAEKYVQHMSRTSAGYSMVRFGNVLGSAGSVLETWAKQIADGGPLTVTDPAMTRYFMTIPEAAALVIQSATMVDESNTTGEVFVLDMGEPISILDLARRFITQHNLEPILASDNQMSKAPGYLPIVFSGVRPGEKLHEQLASDGEPLEPTDHPDILRTSPIMPDKSEIMQIIHELSPEVRNSDPVALASIIRRLVPYIAETALS